MLSLARTASGLALCPLLGGCSSKGEETGAPPLDADGDGYARGEDCDDSDAAVNPVATELCNGHDDDCDGDIDEDDAADAPTWFADTDGDGFGDAGTIVAACDEPTGFTADDTDRDDGDAEVWRGADERWNGLDDDCDGSVEEEVRIEGGNSHSLARLCDGSVSAWGYNGSGQLGDGTRTESSSPVGAGGSLAGVEAIAAGNSYSMALLDDGSVYAWGSNTSGQLGFDTWSPQPVPYPE